jgi:hypothetical protein
MMTVFPRAYPSSRHRTASGASLSGYVLPMASILSLGDPTLVRGYLRAPRRYLPWATEAVVTATCPRPVARGGRGEGFSQVRRSCHRASAHSDRWHAGKSEQTSTTPPPPVLSLIFPRLLSSETAPNTPRYPRARRRAFRGPEKASLRPDQAVLSTHIFKPRVCRLFAVRGSPGRCHLAATPPLGSQASIDLRPPRAAPTSRNASGGGGGWRRGAPHPSAVRRVQRQKQRTKLRTMVVQRGTEPATIATLFWRRYCSKPGFSRRA